MSTTGLSSLDETVHTTNVWLKEIGAACAFDDRTTSFRALRATLHAFRDRLPIEVCAHLSAQLPTIIRGVFYEGWKPAASGHGARSKSEFLKPVADAFSEDETHDAEEIASGVFSVMQRHVSAGEIDHVLHALPSPLRSMFE